MPEQKVSFAKFEETLIQSLTELSVLIMFWIELQHASMPSISLIHQLIFLFSLAFNTISMHKKSTFYICSNDLDARCICQLTESSTRSKRL